MLFILWSTYVTGKFHAKSYINFNFFLLLNISLKYDTLNNSSGVESHKKGQKPILVEKSTSLIIYVCGKVIFKILYNIIFHRYFLITTNSLYFNIQKFLSKNIIFERNNKKYKSIELHFFE